jgi:putative endonuclease
MTHTRQRLGWRGERLAERYLAGHGLTILERNYRCSAGEADLIAQDGDTLVFVEVRTRRGQDYGSPEESITARKQAHLLAVAQAYLAERGLSDIAWRIDVVAVALSARGELLRVEHIENAVEG